LAHELEFIKRRAGIVQQMNYRTNRIIKCEKLRKSMKHRVYNGKMTSVEWRWIKAYSKWVVGEEVRKEWDELYATVKLRKP
jgi:hypothetical protein